MSSSLQFVYWGADISQSGSSRAQAVESVDRGEPSDFDVIIHCGRKPAVMSSRRLFLKTAGVSTASAMCGCTGLLTSDDDEGVPGPNYPSGTLWVYNTSRSDLSVTVTTVDHSPSATLKEVVPSGETDIRDAFVSAQAGTTVTLKARVESFAEDRISFSFMPSGGGSESDTPPQYARLHIPGSDGEVNWQSREASK